MLNRKGLLLFSFCWILAPLQSEVRVEPFSSEWFLVTFSLTTSEKIFWVSEDFSWTPIEMISPFGGGSGKVFLQVLMKPGRYLFKYQNAQGTWFLDPEPPPRQQGVQLIEDPDGFHGKNHCLLLTTEHSENTENLPSMKTKPAIPYSFSTDITHLRWLESPRRCILSLSPELGKEVVLWVDGHAYPLQLKFSASRKKNFGFERTLFPAGKAYFQIGDWFLSPAGLSRHLGLDRFEIPSPKEGKASLLPSLQQHHGKIVYQIFPDRFCKAQVRTRADERPWGKKPRDSWDFFGGDLAGITQKLDYIHALGVEILYLNPVFLADTNHRYNTSDYFQIDPRLGTLEDLQDLIRQARLRGIEILLDGVFNHTGENFFAFQDLLQYEERSPYKDWYCVLKFPLKEKDKINYEGWWGIGSLPKLNIHHPAVRHYLYQVARYWAKQGIAGFRLDVPNEWRGDYWPEFRAQILNEFPHFILIGEIWERADYWLYGNRFDGVTHYPLRHWILEVLQEKPKAIAHFKENVQEFDFYYGSWSRHTNWTLLSSHDTQRFLTEVQHQEKQLQLGALLQYGLPGMPVLYYGDEAGVSGGKDPDCRRCYPWDHPNETLLRYYQQLGQYRKWRLSLKKGNLEFLSAPREVLFFRRTYQQEKTYVICNPSTRVQKIRLPFQPDFTKILFPEQIRIEKHQKNWYLLIQPKSGCYLEEP